MSVYGRIRCEEKGIVYGIIDGAGLQKRSWMPSSLLSNEGHLCKYNAQEFVGYRTAVWSY